MTSETVRMESPWYGREKTWTLGNSEKDRIEDFEM